MRLNKKNLCSIAVCVGVMATLTGGIISAVVSNRVYAGATAFTSTTTLESEYNIGTEITVPTAKFGETEASFKVIMPDGSCTDSDTLTLNKTGNYTIEYFAKVGGTVLKETKSFVVLGSLFTIDGNGYSEYITDSTTSISGVYFSLNDGATIRYNDIVDLNSLWKTKASDSTSLFKLVHMPSVIGESDISRFDVTLTDAYDDTKTVTLRYKQPTGNTSYTYVDATFGDGRYCGFNAAGTSDKEYGVDGYNGTIKAFFDHKTYGTTLRASFTGGTQDSPVDASKCTGVKYDTLNNVLWATNEDAFYNNVITDLENTEIYGSKFDGFTSGLVKVSITPVTFNKASWGVFISEFAGKAITEKDNKDFLPSRQPDLSVDFGEYDDNNIPAVKTGSAYTLFNATAYDFTDGGIPVDVRVFYGYRNAKKVQVAIENGKFTPRYAGVYTVEYEATNSYGISTKKTVEIMAIDGMDKLQMDLTESGEPDYTQAVSAGTTVTAFTQYPTFTNNLGNVDLMVTAVCKEAPSVKYELNAKNKYSFIPTVSGTYEIVYQFSDYSEQQTVIKTFVVEKSDIVYYETNGVYPEYLIKNGIYNFAFVKSYTLETGKPVEKDTVLGVYDNSGALIPVTGNLTISEEFIDENNTVTFAYYPKNVENANKQVITRPVVDTGLYTPALQMQNYFITNTGDITFEATEDGILCDLNELSDGKASFTFINTLMANPLALEIYPYAKGENLQAFDKLNAYLYDSWDDEHFIKVSLVKGVNAWNAMLNDGGESYLCESFEEKTDRFYINFNSYKARLMLNNSLTYEDVCFYGTQTPALFEHGIRLVVEIEGAEGCDGIRVASVNGMKMSASKSDKTPAVVDASRDNNKGEKQLGEIVTLYPFAVYDVISPYISATLTVRLLLPNGTYEDVKSVDGITLNNVDPTKEYQFKLKKYGTYSVKIALEDRNSWNKEGRYEYSIFVVDYTKPVITFANVSNTAKVGSLFKMPKFTVDLENYDYIVLIKDVNGFMQNVKDTNYTFTEKGVYTVTVMVYDTTSQKMDSDYMNIGEATYTIVVK